MFRLMVYFPLKNIQKGFDDTSVLDDFIERQIGAQILVRMLASAGEL